MGKNHVCKHILYNSSCNKAGSVCCIKVQQYQKTRFISTRDGMKSNVINENPDLYSFGKTRKRMKPPTKITAFPSTGISNGPQRYADDKVSIRKAQRPKSMIAIKQERRQDGQEDLPTLTRTDNYGRKMFRSHVRSSKQNNRSEKENENDRNTKDDIVSEKRTCTLTKACQKLGGVCVQSGSCTEKSMKKCKGASCECCIQSKYMSISITAT